MHISLLTLCKRSLLSTCTCTIRRWAFVFFDSSPKKKLRLLWKLSDPPTYIWRKWYIVEEWLKKHLGGWPTYVAKKVLGECCSNNISLLRFKLNCILKPIINSELILIFQKKDLYRCEYVGKTKGGPFSNWQAAATHTFVDGQILQVKSLLLGMNLRKNSLTWICCDCIQKLEECNCVLLRKLSVNNTVLTACGT